MITKQRLAHSTRLIATLPLLLCSVFAAAGEPTIPWKAGASNAPKLTLDGLSSAIEAARSGRAHVVVRFDAVPDAGQRAALAADGLRLLRYVGGGAYFASIDPQIASASQLIAEHGLTSLAPVRSDWKQHPALAAGRIPDWAVVEDGAIGDRRIAAYVVLHADTDLAAGVALVEDLDGVVVDHLESLNALVIETPESSITTLTSNDAVQWIEPPLPQLSLTNDGVRLVTQADEAHESPYDLDGSGVTVLVYDGGVARRTHVDFEGRLTPIDGTGTILHSTHVAGTIGGGGVANPLYRGVAPGVLMVSAGLQGVGSTSPLYANPGDIETDFAEAIDGHGAVVSNASLGSNVEANWFDCEWQGDYGVTAALVDAIVRGSLGAPFRAVWSAGNERQGTRCNVEGYGDYYSIAPPSGAKNHLTVGSINSDDESMTNISSWGPTDDGRIKPDICAPGCQNYGDWGITSCSSADDTAYATLCGTSMASPAVCGLAALVLQDFQQQFPGQPLPRNSMLRALFAHTAADLGNPGPDYSFGYGSARVRDAIDVLRDARFSDASVDHGGVYERTVTINAGDPELKVTLAWDDVPGVPNAAVALINDLDLEVIAPDDTHYDPWTLDPLAPADPAVRTQADHVNNIEQVLVENPISGEWTVRVVGHSVPDGPQPFSLVGDGALNITTVINLPAGLPDLVAAGAPYVLDVSIAAFGQDLVAGTACLRYRVDDGEFTDIALTDLGNSLFSVTLPPRECGEVPYYFVYVETTVEGAATLPANAPAATFSHVIGTWTPVFTDDFERPGDWTVIADAYTGNWERADPEEVVNTGIVTQPEDDHSETGTLCYVTGPLAGLHASMYDVDGGPSHLISPILDLTGLDARVSYWRWYHISVSNDDTLVVAITNDGGETWTTVEDVARSAAEWRYAEWRVSDFVTPTETVQVRFTVSDGDPGSLIESLVDDFSVVYMTCGTQPLPGDIDGDGDVDFDDLNLLLAAYGTADGQPGYDALGDLDDDDDVDFDDLNILLAQYGL